LNSAEVVAALAALISSPALVLEVPSRTLFQARPRTSIPEKMTLRDLPCYTVGEDEIDPEKVYLATAVMHHLVTKQIPWHLPAKGFPKEIERLRKIYQDNEFRKVDDITAFKARQRYWLSF
jgi:hypothetical protein